MGDLGRALGAAHALDLLLAAIIFGTAVVGFGKGTLKLLMVFASVLAGFILASVFYVPFTLIIAPLFGLKLTTAAGGVNEEGVVVGHATSFALLNAVLAVLFVFLLFSFFGHIEIKGRYQSCLDKPIGMMLGFIAGLVIAGILVTLISVPYDTLSTLNLPPQQGQAGAILHQWYVDSILGPPLRSNMLPYLLGILRPIMPGGVPDVLIGTG